MNQNIFEGEVIIMGKYYIRHEENLVGYFLVEADSEDTALQEYEALVNKGVIDFSDLEVIDSSDSIYYAPAIRKVLSVVLEDDRTPYGGIDHPGETVCEFLESTGYFPQSIEELNEILNECGIKPVDMKNA